jgi:hypothetical protein
MLVARSMDQTVPPSRPTEQPAPPQSQAGAAMPECITFLLRMVRTLLAYGRKLDQILPAAANDARFPHLAAGFGTFDVRRILFHVQRGLLKAMMLEKFLLARGAQGRDILPKPPAAPAEMEEIEGLELKLRAQAQPRPASERMPRIDPDDPLTFSIPSLKALEAQVRRQPVGRTLAEICLDLGVVSAVCDLEFWEQLYFALENFGASLAQFVNIQEHRRRTILREQDRRPRTWDQRDQPKDALRQLLGHLLAERLRPNAASVAG